MLFLKVAETLDWEHWIGALPNDEVVPRLCEAVFGSLIHRIVNGYFIRSMHNLTCIDNLSETAKISINFRKESDVLYFGSDGINVRGSSIASMHK